METPVNSPDKAPARPRPRQGTLYQLQMVIGVAIVIATLFTAWTPSIVPTVRNRNELGDRVINPPTPLPPGAPTTTPRTRPLIGIVAGHWGNDSGTVCEDGMTETEVNQNIASLVQKMLVEKGFDVDVLREFDERLAGYQASALVSIHADSCDYINDQATGFKVASAMATKYPERATRLTSCIRNRYGTATGLTLHSTSVTTDMTSYHAFGEIDPNTTAAIIEVGFMKLDRDFLTQNPQKAAEGIVNGILCYFYNESITPPTAAPAATQTAVPTP